MPRTLLIDQHGKIIYDSTGGWEEELRAPIAKLGFAYASLAKQQQVPCRVSQ